MIGVEIEGAALLPQATRSELQHTNCYTGHPGAGAAGDREQNQAKEGDQGS